MFAVLTDDFRVLVLDVFSPSDPLCSFSVDPTPEKSGSATSGTTGTGGGWLAKTMSQAVGLLKSSVGWLPMGGLAFLGQGGEHIAVSFSNEKKRTEKKKMWNLIWTRKWKNPRHHFFIFDHTIRIDSLFFGFDTHKISNLNIKSIYPRWAPRTGGWSWRACQRAK